jgi:hypothetical protein
MLAVQAAFHEDNDFSPAEALFCSQLVLPGRFVNTYESQSPSFLEELQTAMAGRSPPPTRHNSLLAPTTLPEELLLVRFMLPRNSAATTGPSLRWILLRAGALYTLLPAADRGLNRYGLLLHLKPTRTPADTDLAQPPRRERTTHRRPQSAA